MIFAYTQPDDPLSEEMVRFLIQMGVDFKNISLEGNTPARKFLDENGYKNAPHVFEGNVYIGHKCEEVEKYLESE